MLVGKRLGFLKEWVFKGRKVVYERMYLVEECVVVMW